MSYCKRKTLVRSYAIFIYFGVEISIPASKLQHTANQIEVSSRFFEGCGQNCRRKKAKRQGDLRAELEHNG